MRNNTIIMSAASFPKTLFKIVLTAYLDETFKSIQSKRNKLQTNF